MKDILRIKHSYLDRFVNSFVIKIGKHSLLVDTGLFQNRGALLNACEGRIVVLSTHGHWDHIGGHSFLQAAGALVLAHEGDWRCFEDHAWQWRHLYAQFERDFDIPPIRASLYREEIGGPLTPDGRLADGQALCFDGLAVDVLATPGHSPGSICFHLPQEGVIFTGDTLAGSGFFASMPQYCDRNAYITSMRRLYALDVERVFCAHSEPGPGKMLRARAQEAVEYAYHLDDVVRAFFHACKRPAQAALQDVCAFVAAREGKAQGSGTCITTLTHLKALENEFPEAGRLARTYDF